jgi:hypothetical protein
VAQFFLITKETPMTINLKKSISIVLMALSFGLATQNPHDEKSPLPSPTPINESCTGLIYLFSSTKNMGDRDQVVGVGNAIEDIYPKCTLKPMLDIDVQTFINQKMDKNGLIITVGKEGAELIKALPKDSPHETIYLSHQMTDDLKSLVGKATWIAVPNHALEIEDRALITHSPTHLIEGIGVPHSLKGDDVDREYETNKQKFKDYEYVIAIMMGGDAQMTDGTWKYYTKKDVDHLVESLLTTYRDHPNAHFIILNGPRTGKFIQQQIEIKQDEKNNLKDKKNDLKKDKTTKNKKLKSKKELKTKFKTMYIEDLKSHRNGNTDAITNYFIDKMIYHGMKYTLWDFQFDNTEKWSPFKAVLGYLRAHHGIMIMPGESTSMVSQSADMLGKIYVYNHSAMNKGHFRHIKKELDNGRVFIINEGMGEHHIPKHPSSMTANQIAHLVCQPE